MERPCGGAAHKVYSPSAQADCKKIALLAGRVLPTISSASVSRVTMKNRLAVALIDIVAQMSQIAANTRHRPMAATGILSKWWQRYASPVWMDINQTEDFAISWRAR